MKRALIFLVYVLVFTSSCKKEESKPDNPNVNHRDLNLEMKVGSSNGNAFMEADLNGDGMNDFEFSSFLDPIGSYKERSLLIYSSNSVNSIISDSFLVRGNYKNIVKEQTEGAMVDMGSGFFALESFVAVEKESQAYPLTTHGFAGKGDKLLAIMFSIGGNVHYGWMKVNLSGDYQHFILKEIAYEIRPETEIRIGDI